MNASGLTAPWFYLTAMRTTITDYTKDIYYINVADAFSGHCIACHGFHDGKRNAPDSYITLKKPWLAMHTEIYKQRMRYFKDSLDSDYNYITALITRKHFRLEEQHYYSIDIQILDRQNTVDIIIRNTRWRFETRSFQETWYQFIHEYFKVNLLELDCG